MFSLNKAKISAILVFFLTLFWFQNCGQVNKDDTLGGQATALETSRESTSSVDTNNLKSMTYQFTEAQVQDRGGGRIVEVPTTQIMTINLQQGIYTFQGADEEYCLNNADKSEIQSILSSASICETKPENSETVCAEIYKVPYATLVYENDEIRLGEGTSSCHLVDLCESYPQMLKGVLADLKNNKDQRICK